jgi:hypothetical protein
MPASHQLIVEAEAGGPGFINKGYPLSREMLAHVTESSCAAL